MGLGAEHGSDTHGAQQYMEHTENTREGLYRRSLAERDDPGLSPRGASVVTATVGLDGTAAGRVGHLLARFVVPVARAGRPWPRHAVLAATVTTPAAGFKPTAGALPGGHTLLTLVNGLGGWALIIALAGLVIGAALWAIGSHSQNYQQSFVGKRAVLVSGAAALIIGAAPTIIDFFFHTGLHLSSPAGTGAAFR